jgi:hypothetical protein
MRRFLFSQHFIHKTPAPVFARLERLHHWMLRGVEMLCGVAIFGRIAAANVPAFQTQSQVEPFVSHL